MLDSFIGRNIDGYSIIELIGAGCVGRVYKASNEAFYDTRAIKFVPMSAIEKKIGWEQEIIKVNKLHHSSVVRYHSHNLIVIDGIEYLYIMWDYIPGKSLRKIIEKKQLTMQMVVDIVLESLSVFFACKEAHIQHADFHSGNIIIQDVDPFDIEQGRRKIWITDFGYGSFSPSRTTPPMEDYNGLARIIQECLDAIDFHQLSQEIDRHRYRVLKHEFPRYLHETNPTEGSFVREPAELRKQLFKLFETNESIPTYQKDIGDFLAAELIGDRYDEWDALFVPKFLATSSLLDKNICVLTGLRGCGKTMMFKRLSYELQNQLGPSGIPGEDSFIGFYLNARVLAEAFPWLPENKHQDARRQVLNFFNVKWCIEILQWLRVCIRNEAHTSVIWLYEFFAPFFPNNVFTSTDSVGVINSIIENCQLELARTKLDSNYDPDGKWRFDDYAFLSQFLQEISKHHAFGKGKNIYFFLDDYSTPMINSTMQEILNPVIFRRTADVYFKVSTESSESFISKSLNGKILENGADYKLVDLGSELFKSNQDKARIKDIIISIFEKRIVRSSIFDHSSLHLAQVLGDNEYNNNELAYAIRTPNEKTLYSGIDVFCDLWSSDIRELIKVFSEMLTTEGKDSIERAKAEGFSSIPIISRKNQDHVLREAGGRLLASLTATTNPSGTFPKQDGSETYGEHLRDIVIAFQEIASFDLKNKNSKNQDANPPKQARKIELTSTNGTLSGFAADYYKGLIRYGVFIQDFRAKSVRGTPAQRLYLRGLLIPYSRLTFSRRDCITLEWEDFEKLLLHPREFVADYKRKTQVTPPLEGQIQLTEF